MKLAHFGSVLVIIIVIIVINERLNFSTVMFETRVIDLFGGRFRTTGIDVEVL